jgi:hypothetical protein
MSMRLSRVLSLLVVIIVISSIFYIVDSWYSGYTSLFSEKLQSKTLVGVGGRDVYVEAYLPGDPLEVLNSTIYHHYSSAFIFAGTSDMRDYCDRTGKCQFRTMAVAEVSCLVGKVFGAYYYETAREVGYDDRNARIFALEKVSETVKAGEWISFSSKLEIGRGNIGNSDSLLVILIGPLDGAETNRVYVPREGVVILEAIDESILYQEAVLLDAITGIKCSK